MAEHTAPSKRQRGGFAERGERAFGGSTARLSKHFVDISMVLTKKLS